jgi:hypothetical protein
MIIFGAGLGILVGLVVSSLWVNRSRPVDWKLVERILDNVYEGIYK